MLRDSSEDHNGQALGVKSVNEENCLVCPSYYLDDRPKWVNHHAHPSESEYLKKWTLLRWTRWCFLVIPLYFVLRPWNFPFNLWRKTPSPRSDMSNYSSSSLQPVSAYGVSHVHGLTHTAFVANVTLEPFTFQPLALGSIKPVGWMKDQMSLMSDGLAGHQYDFYHLVHDSSWLGGHSEYSSLNEGFPYWFNGLVPLAYGLDDERLKTQVHDAAGYVITHQQNDGWLGPETTNATRDLWARFPLFLGLYQLAEADSSQSATIIPAMYKFVTLMHSMLIDNLGFTQFWGQVRYQDMVVSLQWMYEHEPGDNKQLLMETMYLLKQRGLDWSQYYNADTFITEDLDLIQPAITGDSAIFPFVHGVNTGQGLKANAVIYRFTGNQSLLQTTRNGVKWTFEYHGDAAGTIIGDERQIGLAPNRGSELCTAVETMYSLSYLYHLLGDNSYADACERIAFNALPVMITSNHWAHQYMHPTNEPFVHKLDYPTPFWNVGENGIVYDLEPNYPCCTVNMPQGVPKFLSAAFVNAGQNGLAHALLSPASVDTKLLDGTSVQVVCDTNYPFSTTLYYTVTASADFTFSIRVPEWSVAGSSSISIGDKKNAKPLSPDPHTGMTSVKLPKGNSTITYTLGAQIVTTARSNDTVAVYNGALLYSLDVGATIVALPPNLFNSGSYPDGPDNEPSQVHNYNMTNTKPWNIAIDPSTLGFVVDANSTGQETLANPIWAPGAPPTSITAKGCEIAWPIATGTPDRVPLAVNGQRTCTGPTIDVVLRPYASLKISMAELPTVSLGKT